MEPIDRYPCHCVRRHGGRPGCPLRALWLGNAQDSEGGLRPGEELGSSRRKGRRFSRSSGGRAHPRKRWTPKSEKGNSRGKTMKGSVEKKHRNPLRWKSGRLCGKYNPQLYIRLRILKSALPFSCRGMDTSLPRCGPKLFSDSPIENQP